MGRSRQARTMGIAALALLAGACATTAVIDAPNALAGHDLETAVNLYGRIYERAQIGGQSFYIWRRTAVIDGRSMGCELRVELGYRQMIRQTQLEGFPQACQLFSVVYTAMPQTRPGAADERPKTAEAKPATGCPGCRPVGSPTATAAAEPPRR